MSEEKVEQRIKCNKCKVALRLENFEEKRDGILFKSCNKCRVKQTEYMLSKEKKVCTLCDCTFSTNGILQQHIKAVHDKIKDFNCTLCDSKFSSNSILQQHIKQVHDKIKDFDCDLCDLKFSYNNNLQRHIKQVHDKIKDFDCDLCDSKFSTNGQLQQHIKQVHDKIKDFDCDLCDLNFSTSGQLQQHIKAVHDKIKDFNCTLCDSKFSSNSILQQHIKQVHDKIKDFDCDLCDLKFSYNNNLQRHIKQVHDKIKDFDCDLCDSKFSTNGNLQQHINICTGQRKISSLEHLGITALELLNIYEDEDHVFDNTYSKFTDYCKHPLRFDLRFHHFKIMIEFDGQHHFEPVRFGGISQERAEENFEKQKLHDKLKNSFCDKFGYRMIRISYKDVKNLDDMLCILHENLYDIVEF